MGLLDSFYNQGSAPPNPDASWPQLLSSPMGQGLLGAAFSFAANARRGAPLNSLGAGGLGGLMAYGSAQDRQAKLAEEAQQRQLRTMQMDKLRSELADYDLAKKTATQFFTPGKPAIGALDSSLPPEFQTGAVPMPAQAPRFDMTGYANARMSQNPTEGLRLMAELQKETPINKLDVKDFTPASVQKFAQTKNYGDLVRLDKLHFQDTGGAIAGLDPFTGRPVSTSPKTGNPFSDLVLADGKGGVMPNTPLVNVKTGIAKAGATRIDNKIEAKLGESIAGQVGPILKDSQIQANAAADMIDASNRVIAAAQTGKLFVGPGSNVKLKAAQVADVLGVAGKDTTERIANTRQAIRGLAEMTLQGRKEMRGEGQITEQESALAERAKSGNLEDLTGPEVVQLAQASARASRYIYGQHQTMVDNVSQDPNTAGLAKFYKSRPIPSIVSTPKAATPPPTGGVRFLGFEGQ